MPLPTDFTLILRFRDLVTAEGLTIEAHKQKIGEKGKVWWGWWNKAGEHVPIAAFTDLQKRLKAGPIFVFLFDSGREFVYRANCTNVRNDPAVERIASPEVDTTPEYYKTQSYLAWFCFDAIEPVDAAELKKWSYERVDELFGSEKSRYDAFYGKQVYSPRELRQQDRSMWFVRPFKTTDSSHEVLLLDAKTFSPEDFPSDYRVSSSDSLVWLSDLHFSEDAHHRFPQQTKEAEMTLTTATEKALENREIGGVLISGDFTWKATPAEFQQAFNYIKELSSRLRIANYDFLIGPGNHDIKFSEDSAKSGDEITRSSPEASQAYRAFYEQLFFRQPNEFLASGRRFLLARSVPVEVASLNSNHLQQHKSLFQGHGFVGQQQLDKVAEEMQWTEPVAGPLPVRILMLHHHLLPVTYRDIPKVGGNYSVTLDAEAVVQWIVRHRVKIVLHGHMHQPFHAKIGRSVDNGPLHEFWVLGMGSTGVAQDHLGEIAKNTVGLLTFSPGNVDYNLFSIHPINKATLLGPTISIPLDAA